jgi:transposase
MGDARGVIRDFDVLEKRRMEATGYLAEGFNNSEIGRRLKASNQSVSRWREEYQAGGKKALRQASRAGRKALLTAEQNKELINKLIAGPERLGYQTPLWTYQRVAELIKQEFQVRYHAGHVWRILRQLGWSPQRPTGRALERDEVAIHQWKKKPGPTSKKPVNKAEPAPSSLSYLGPSGADADLVPPFQLAVFVVDCWTHRLELLLRTLCSALSV